METAQSSRSGSQRLFFKIGAIVLAAAVLVVPLSMVGELVGERRALRDQAAHDTARTLAAAQRLEGLTLILPCTDRFEEAETLPNGQVLRRTRTASCDVHLLPERLGISGDLATEVRHRGIHPVLVYRARLELEGMFAFTPPRAPPGVRRTWGAPQLSLGLSDVRGIAAVPRLTWNGDATAFDSGPGLGPWAQGIHAPVAIEPAQGGQASFTIALDLTGMERFEIVPAAGEIVASLRSDWPHPSFTGRFAPQSRAVTDAGFEASWRTSDLASNVRHAFGQCLRSKCEAYAGSSFGVSLIQPVDIYQRTYRALHYGILFVGLTFALFFGAEIRAGLRMHPLQYALVGLALVVFFVLLLAFAEHIGFAAAYAIAAGACVGLVGVYVRGILGTRARTSWFVLLLSALYAALYVVLGAEDYALVMGAVLLFAALAAFMLCTRRLDWYALPAPSASNVTEPRAAAP